MINPKVPEIFIQAIKVFFKPAFKILTILFSPVVIVYIPVTAILAS